MLSTPTSSLSVDLLVFNFCLVELTIGNPLPIVNPPPVWLCILGCTSKEALAYHINTSLPLVLRIRERSQSFLRCCIRWLNFLQSSTSGALTLVGSKNAIAVLTSGLARLLTYKVLATRLWNSIVPSSLSFSASLSTMNKSSGAALVLAAFFFFVTALKPSL